MIGERMPSNEEGEFELVLGQRQLLSVFFILVVLLGVFFTMGYVVGRSTDGGQVVTATNSGAQPTPMVVEPPVNPAERPAPVGQPVETARNDPPAKPVATASAEPPKVEPPKTAQAKPEPAKATPTPPPPPSTGAKPTPPPAAVAGGGTYLQVAATRKLEAELLVEVLGKKGFPAKMQPVPDSALFRVLVGPLSDTAVLEKMRGDLTAAGFQSFPRKL
jgi:cell division septation protein DedD